MTYKAKSSRPDAGKPRPYRGKPVEDATYKFQPVVTGADCRRGKKSDPEHCAGAIAIKRTHPGTVLSVHVHRCFTYVELPHKVIRYKTGHALRDQVIRYDAAKKFEPGSYTIGPVPQSTIAARGTQHSPPDRPRGDPNSPKKRQHAISAMRQLGREGFHFE